MANTFVGAAPSNFWDKLWDAVKGVMTDGLWRDMPRSQKDPVTGEHASVAKIQPSGAVDWPSTGGLMAGSALLPMVV